MWDYFYSTGLIWSDVCVLYSHLGNLGINEMQLIESVHKSSTYFGMFCVEKYGDVLLQMNFSLARNSAKGDVGRVGA